MKKLSGFGMPTVCAVCVAALIGVMASTAAAQSADDLIAKIKDLTRYRREHAEGKAS